MCKTTTRVLLWSLFVLLHQTVWSQSRPTFQEIELTQELVEVGGQTMVKIKAKGGHKFSWNTGATTQSIEVSLRSKDRYTVEVEESDGRKSSISTSLALPALLSTQRGRSTINQLAPAGVLLPAAEWLLVDEGNIDQGQAGAGGKD